MAVQPRPLHTESGSGKALWGPGDLYTYLVTGEQSGGTLFAMEAYVPDGAGPPPHIHAREDETLLILEGELEVQLGDEVRIVSAGDFVWLPKGVPHRFTNVSGKPMRMILSFLPAGIEHFFEEVFEPVENRSAEPPPVTPELVGRLLAAAPHYGLEFLPPPEN
jgi:quercetin dioxygenase-like cupin family protein